MRRMRSTRMIHIAIIRVAVMLQDPIRINPQGVMVFKEGLTVTIPSDPGSRLPILSNSSAKSMKSRCRSDLKPVRNLNNTQCKIRIRVTQ